MKRNGKVKEGEQIFHVRNEIISEKKESEGKEIVDISAQVTRVNTQT